MLLGFQYGIQALGTSTRPQRGGQMNEYSLDFNKALQKQLTVRQRLASAKDGGKVERIWSRKQIEQAFIETFELIGGVPRLALWANQEENYGEFLKLMMKLAPKDTGGAIAGAVLEYRSNVPQSPLNRAKPAEADETVVEIEDQ